MCVCVFVYMHSCVHACVCVCDCVCAHAPNHKNNLKLNILYSKSWSVLYYSRPCLAHTHKHCIIIYILSSINNKKNLKSLLTHFNCQFPIFANYAHQRANVVSLSVRASWSRYVHSFVCCKHAHEINSDTMCKDFFFWRFLWNSVSQCISGYNIDYMFQFRRKDTYTRHSETGLLVAPMDGYFLGSVGAWNLLP